MRRTNVAVFEKAKEKVLSNTSPYMPPCPGATAYVPIDTLSASHLPYHCIDMKPFAFNCSWAVEVSFLALDSRRRFSKPGSGCSEEGAAFSTPVLATLLLSVLPAPGCLKIPKFLAERQFTI